MGWGDGAQEWVPRPIYDQMGPALQKLVRHRTCGIEDELQTPVKCDRLRMTSLAGFALLTPRLCCQDDWKDPWAESDRGGSGDGRSEGPPPLAISVLSEAAAPPPLSPSGRCVKLSRKSPSSL